MLLPAVAIARSWVVWLVLWNITNYLQMFLNFDITVECGVGLGLLLRHTHVSVSGHQSPVYMLRYPTYLGYLSMQSGKQGSCMLLYGEWPWIRYKINMLASWRSEQKTHREPHCFMNSLKEFKRLDNSCGKRRII